MSGFDLPLARYTCHKVVQAGRIIDAKVTNQSGGVLTVEAADGSHGTIAAPIEYFRKHHPHVGGYFVVYEDGYWSFSPAQPFENRYQRCAS